MTRKHFNAFAAAIRNAIADHGPSAAIADLAHDIAAICKQDNAAFDTLRFLAACGLERSN